MHTDPSPEDDLLPPGAEVVALNSERLGTLATVVDSYLVIEEGRPFPEHDDVLVSAIDHSHSDAAILALVVSQDQVVLRSCGERGEVSLPDDCDDTTERDAV
jgi:hypothetical protein